jgi:molybdopterin converting factor subunit 1
MLQARNHGLVAHATLKRTAVLLFASIRDAAGVDRVQVDAATIRDVSAQLAGLFPEAAGLIERSRFAVNQQFASPDTALQEGDEVAVIPPVSGG